MWTTSEVLVTVVISHVQLAVTEIGCSNFSAKIKHLEKKITSIALAMEINRSGNLPLFPRLYYIIRSHVKDGLQSLKGIFQNCIIPGNSS